MDNDMVTGSSSRAKYLAFFLLVAHQTAVSLVRFTRTTHPSPNHGSPAVGDDELDVTRKALYNASTAIFLTEFVKALISCVMLLRVHPHPARWSWSWAQWNGRVWTSIVAFGLYPCYLLQDLFSALVLAAGPRRYKDLLEMIIPGLLYTFQNHLLYMGLAELDTPMFLVTSQLKILTTALSAVFLCRRVLTVYQWLALCLLALGVVLVQFQPTLSGSTTPSPTSEPTRVSGEQNQLKGFCCIVLSCVLSGLAGCWFERLVKSPTDAPHVSSKPSQAKPSSPQSSSSDQNPAPAPIDTLWTKNIQLSIPSLLISYLAIYISPQSRRSVLERGFLSGYDYLVWCVVLYNAIGGILVSILVRQSSALTKNFATSVSIVLSSLVSSYINGVKPGMNFMIGTSLVMASIKLYSSTSSLADRRNQVESAMSKKLQ